MQLGVVFPQTEIGADPSGVRAYALATEEAGYAHLLVFDHVLGASPERLAEALPNRRAPYTIETLFHEPFVLFGYLGALTRRLELVTGVIIAPQRQTALLAKQAAEVDVLSGGRLRLGLGIGWNPTEYEALNEDFHTRGRRIGEQITVMRRLWTEPEVTFAGRWHKLDRVGIRPLPGRSIPVWMGGMAENVIKRAARLADGWFPQFQPSPESKAAIEHILGLVSEAGRDPSAFGIEGRITITTGSPESWAEQAEAWRAMGATHLSVNTMGGGFASPEQHIEAIRRFKEAYGRVAVPGATGNG